MDDAWLVEETVWAAVGPYRAAVGPYRAAVGPYRAAVGPYRAAPGATVAETGTVRWFRTGIDYEGLNGVLSARIRERELEDTIHQALAPFREAGRPMLWHV